MKPDSEMVPIEEADTKKRTLILSMAGVIALGVCALLSLTYVWFKPVQNDPGAKYFSSPTAARQSANTPALTQTSIPNLTATQAVWVKPDQSPTLGSAAEAQKAIENGMSYLEEFAAQTPDTPEINQPGDIYVYDIPFDQPEPVIWSYGWCTTTQAILEENLSHTKIEFLINGESAELDHFFIENTTRDDGSLCRDYTATIKEWPQGQHQLEVRVTFTQPTNDGWNLYPAGMHTFKYIVTVN